MYINQPMNQWINQPINQLKCNRFEAAPTDGTEAQKAKVELDRYLHYYQRYHGHDRSLKFVAANRLDAEKKMVEIQEAGEVTDWIDAAKLS